MAFVLPTAGQILHTFLLSQRHEFFMNVCVFMCVHEEPSAASIAISAAAVVILPQWLQCRQEEKKKEKKNLS